MGIAGVGFSSKGEAELAAAVLRKILKVNTRVIERREGFWMVRTSFDRELVKGAS